MHEVILVQRCAHDVERERHGCGAVGPAHRFSGKERI
jgi:hypothetical protein